jgi:hypothetical protein
MVSFRDGVNSAPPPLPTTTSTRSDSLACLAVGCLAGIIVNLVLIPGFEDVVPRDFGLLLVALALSRLVPIFRRDGVGASKGLAW